MIARGKHRAYRGASPLDHSTNADRGLKGRNSRRIPPFQGYHISRLWRSDTHYNCARLAASPNRILTLCKAIAVAKNAMPGRYGNAYKQKNHRRQTHACRRDTSYNFECDQKRDD